MKKKILIVALVAFVLLFAAPFTAAIIIYESSFDYRCETSPEDRIDLASYPDLERSRHTFASDKGQMLVGYLYRHSAVESPKGIIVFSHGMGRGGQAGYTDIFSILAERGYYVFAYDATANDESEGRVMGGLPQGYIDLDHAIDYVLTLDELGGLPMLLMGYSWGAMSVANVLNYHPEVVAVCSVAGWNRSLDLIKYFGERYGGDSSGLLLPYAALYERLKYGDYASSTAMDGFEGSDARIMVIHGAHDTTVPPEYGYERYYAEYSDDDRFSFVWYEDRDHAVLYDGELRDAALIHSVADFFDSALAV